MTDAQAPKPNEEQEAAIAAIAAWLDEPAGRPYYLLSGYAGTGKTFSVKHLLTRVKGTVVFTAPTNKATKVLRESLTTATYTPECCTIYSLLSLRLEPSGEVKVLRVNEESVPDLAKVRLVVVDEASMVNRAVLEQISRAASRFPQVQWLFMGDPAQLPPVKELQSPVWQIGAPTSELTRVMRHDNQILELVTQIRKVVDHPAPTVKLQGNFADGQGVWKLSPETWHRQMLTAAKLGMFSDPSLAKVIAWRNVTVDAYNKQIRAEIFDDPSERWLPKDRVLFTEPAKPVEELDAGYRGSSEPLARTDDEGEVAHVNVCWHPLHQEFRVYSLVIKLDTGKVVKALNLHPSSQLAFDRKVKQMADEAKASPRLWKAFWEFKESFHGLRHAYAITAHRAQGSTYDNVFVDVQDILLNRNRQEAFRCLYVACSRPKYKLLLA